MRIVWVFSAFGLLAACGGPPPVLFDGMKIRARVSATSDDKRDFVVSVPGAAAMSGPASRAARYEATLYCLDRFAGSDVVWADGVLTDPTTLIAADGSLMRQGRCVQR